MAYIDPDGMFGGDRMAMLTDGARYAWPWFWCASNSLGRMKLNYRDFVGTVFRQFKKLPTEAQFWDWVSQYHECFLMFVYQSNGEAWGQWYVTEKYLPTYKLERDKKTPSPNPEFFILWTKRYSEQKIQRFSSKCRVFNNSEKFQEVLPISSNFSLGETVIETEIILTPVVAKRSAYQPTSDSVKKFLTPSASEGGFDDFWKVWWNKNAKAEALKAFSKAAKQFGVAFLISHCLEDRKRWESTESWEWRRNLHPATWLRGKRWEDELPPPKNSNGTVVKIIPVPVDPSKIIPYDPFGIIAKAKNGEKSNG